MARRGHGITAVVWLVASGCYAAIGPDGAPCAENGACPTGQTCESGVCTSTPGEGSGNEPTGEAVDEPIAPFAASNGANPDLLDGATGFLGGSGNILVNSDTGEISRDGVIVRPAGPGLIDGVTFEPTPTIGMFAASSFVIAPGATLRAFGSRSLLVLVAGDATIEGTLTVSSGTCKGGASDPRCGGPGGGDGGFQDMPARGCGAGGRGADAGDTGGGGGGFGQLGAAGGTELDDGLTPFNGAVGGRGGTIEACARVSLIPLTGGSGGGAGGGEATIGWAGSGGGGGGGVQVTAFGNLRVSGTIVANGGGGGGSARAAGGGGGSGGNILLEALAIDLMRAVLAANGGGGGGGGGAATDAGSPGLPSETPAPGGSSLHASGGDGGTGSVSPKPGTAGSNDTGGGGGAVGSIRLRTRQLTEDAAVESPDASRVQIGSRRRRLERERKSPSRNGRATLCW